MPTYQPGDVLTWDFQSDIFAGRYRLVTDEGNGNWVAERLAPSDEEIERIFECGASHEAQGFSYLGTIEEVMAEIERRQSEAGSTFRLRIVSAATYYAAF